MHTKLWETQGSSPMEMKSDHLQFLFLVEDLPNTLKIHTKHLSE